MKFQAFSLTLAAGFTATALLVAPIALAEDASQLPTEPGQEIDPPETDPMHKFDSRERLARVVLFGDRRELAEEKLALEEAEALLERAINAGAEQEVIDRIQAEVDRRQATLDSSREDIARTLERIADLSDEEVFAYNRALNNAISSKLVPYLDAELLERALCADLDRHQINALTQALEQEARFTIKSERLRDLAEETGDDSYLAKAERMEAKAESQKQKFLAKIGDTSHVEPLPTDEIREEGRRHARAAAREVAHKEARKIARESARGEARVASRDRMRDKQAAKAAQREAIQLARATAREEVRNQGKANGKNKNN